MNKPDWRKGDILVPAEGAGMGRKPFVAEHDPTFYAEPNWYVDAGWHYCETPARKFRRATAADIDRAVADERREIKRHTRELGRLEGLRAKLTEDAR